ncbi:MAG: glycosyl hydrolase family 18 protein [Minisyncoccota bacterium]
MRRPSPSIFFLLFLVSVVVPAHTFAAVRSLALGSSGGDVGKLQTTLIAKGYLESGKNTGYFGPLTRTAVQKFQCDRAIVCATATSSGYGVYGPRTRAALSGDSAPGGSDKGGSTEKRFEVSGWIPYWRAATGTQDVSSHLSQLASVMPFAYTLKNNGTLADTAHLTREPWTSFMAKAKQDHVRVVPSILWGDGEAIHRRLSDATTRIALEDQIATTVKENGFDGIDIDFEAKKHETVDYFSTFLKGLTMRLGDKWLYCTVEARMPLSDRYLSGATIPPDATDYANDYVQMNKYCDRVEIMAYDQGTIDLRLNSARSAPYAPVADPGWVANLVTLAMQSIDKNKIVIGIPTYGYEYTVTPLAGAGFQYSVQWPFNMKYATDLAAQLHITPTRTSANEMGFVYNPEALHPAAPAGNESTQTQQTTASSSVANNAGSQVDTTKPFSYLTWSDAQAVADKVALAHQLGVRGVAIFKFDGGEDPGIWGVLK